jgi:hypothetical protein
MVETPTQRLAMMTIAADLTQGLVQGGMTALKCFDDHCVLLEDYPEVGYGHLFWLGEDESHDHPDYLYPHQCAHPRQVDVY